MAGNAVIQQPQLLLPAFYRAFLRAQKAARPFRLGCVCSHHDHAPQRLVAGSLLIGNRRDLDFVFENFLLRPAKSIGLGFSLFLPACERAGYGIFIIAIFYLGIFFSGRFLAARISLRYLFGLRYLKIVQNRLIRHSFAVFIQQLGGKSILKSLHIKFRFIILQVVAYLNRKLVFRCGCTVRCVLAKQIGSGLQGRTRILIRKQNIRGEILLCTLDRDHALGAAQAGVSRQRKE